MILTIDLGNTFTKVAAFQATQLTQSWRFPTQQWKTDLPQLLQNLPATAVQQVGWISVANPVDIHRLSIWDRFTPIPEITHVHTGISLPLESQYLTPDTLGIDRIVAVIGARTLVQQKPVMVIDAGTALTFDVATAAGTYLGGSISPGMHMRFQALHRFTARLPLVETDKNFSLIGNTTTSCIRSGVMNGILAEVDGVIQQYQSLLGAELCVCLTGGDMRFFENHLKSYNFADAFLIHRGINFILSP